MTPAAGPTVESWGGGFLARIDLVEARVVGKVVRPSQYLAKASLNSTYNSGVGSFDTLSSVTNCANDGNAVRAKLPARATAKGNLIKLRRKFTECHFYEWVAVPNTDETHSGKPSSS